MKYLKRFNETVKRINNFLTPEKEEELINLFRKRRK